MKFLYTTISLFFLINVALFSQKFQPGYLTFPNDSTVFVDIQLTSNNKAAIKYQENGQTLKAFKIKLKDYGTIVDNERKSDYANSAFKEVTFNAYYVSRKTNDTTSFYFLEHSYHKITGYLPNREKLILYPEDIATVSIDNDENEIFYDGLDLKEYGSPKVKNSHKFLERIINGKVILYKTGFTKSDTQILKKEKYTYDMNESQKTYKDLKPFWEFNTYIGLETNINNVTVYILRREEQLYFSVYHNTIYNGEAQLKNAIKDFPYLANKIGKPGYQFIDIPDIIEEYNAYWEKRQKQ